LAPVIDPETKRAIGQYFSYPGRRFRHIATEYLEDWDGLPVVPKALSWLRAEIFERKSMADHDLFFARVTKTHPGRLGDPPLLYSARHGWRVTGGKAREPGMSIRDRLLERLAAAGVDSPPEASDDDEGDGGPGTPR
jgi:hypothetical protein